MPLPFVPLPLPAELGCRVAAGVAEGPNTIPFTAPSFELSSAGGRSATGGVDAGMINGGAVPRLPRLEGFLAAGFPFGLARPEPFDFAGGRRTGEDERDGFAESGVTMPELERAAFAVTGAGALCPDVLIGRPLLVSAVGSPVLLAPGVVVPVVVVPMLVVVCVTGADAPVGAGAPACAGDLAALRWTAWRWGRTCAAGRA